MKDAIYKSGRKRQLGVYDPATDQIRIDAKGKIRKQIEAEVGDIYDLIADQSKRIALLERMLLRIIQNIGNGDDIATAVSDYTTSANLILGAIESDQAQDRIDLYESDDPVNTELITKLMTRSNQISAIVGGAI